MEALRDELIENYFGDEEINDYFDYQYALYKIAFKLSLREQHALFPLAEIDDNKVILISDTHFGSVYQNYEYIDLVYEYAAKHGYKYILHGGDLFQGDVPPVINEGENVSKQVHRLVSYYPYDKNITTYILLGNHDHFIYRNFENSYNIIKTRSDLNILGIRYAYINWMNNLISIQHYVKKRKCKIDFPRIETLVKFHGHRHELNVIDSHIFLPTLSNDLKDYGKLNYPGFLTGFIDNDKVYINSHVFNDKKIKDAGLVLEKKINERDIIK